MTAESGLKTPATNGTTGNNDEEVVAHHVHDQILQMQKELECAKEEVKNYKKAAAIAKKEADDFQVVLDEEKRRSKNRIADLQKENFALSDEVEKLKQCGGSGDSKRQKFTDDLGEDGIAANTINSLRRQLKQLGEQYAKAICEIE
uniref:Uncharacterized protein n=1 Tax=Panagrolaimus sp. PS1159 TaxID=55785 RepID=A0AC35GYI3_9BILA